MDELSDVLRRLTDAGYDADFYARDGFLLCANCEERVDPTRVQVDDVVRLEGDSDPDEEVAIYALSEGPCGRRGTYVVVYGPRTPNDDVAVQQVLQDARRR
jgi:hypothetical protein